MKLNKGMTHDDFVLQLKVANFQYECSCVRYVKSEDDLRIGMIIGVCIVVFIVVLILIFLIFVLVECVFCGRNEKKQVDPDDQYL